jgi:hypothetical protein
MGIRLYFKWQAASGLCNIFLSLALILSCIPLSYPFAASKTTGQSHPRSKFGNTGGDSQSYSIHRRRLPSQVSAESLLLRMKGGTFLTTTECSDGRVIIGDAPPALVAQDSVLTWEYETYQGPLRPGDEIISVDGLPSWQLGSEGVIAMLDCDDDVVSVEVKRGNSILALPWRRQGAPAGQWKWNQDMAGWETNNLLWNRAVHTKSDMVEAMQRMFQSDQLLEEDIIAALETAESQADQGVVEESIIEQAVSDLGLGPVSDEPSRQKDLERLSCIALAGLCQVSAVSPSAIKALKSCLTLRGAKDSCPLRPRKTRLEIIFLCFTPEKLT